MPTARIASVPHHYWKTSVEWCDKSVATAGDKWAGYGSATLESIAARAGAAQATVYAYFPQGREQLFRDTARLCLAPRERR